MQVTAPVETRGRATGTWRLPMPFLSWRRSLDAAIRAWCASGQADGDGWQEIETEVRARAHKRAKRYGFSPDDREDLSGEVILRLLRLLRLRGDESIRDFDKFTWRVIDNTCKRQIQRNKPVWTKLKGEIIETLRGKRGAVGFALWDGDEMGGYEVWNAGGIRYTPRYVELQQDDRPLRRYLNGLGRPERMPLPALLKAVFDYLETPLAVNELTTLVFNLQGLQEIGGEPPMPLDEMSHSPVEEVDGDLLQAIAAAFHRLPRDECAAFLFHLQPEVAERLLLNGGDGTPASLAERLQMPLEELEQALDEIPWRDLGIAMFLDIQEKTDRKKQERVINLRQSALRHIRRYVEKLGLNP